MDRVPNRKPWLFHGFLWFFPIFLYVTLGFFTDIFLWIEATKQVQYIWQTLTDPCPPYPTGHPPQFLNGFQPRARPFFGGALPKKGVAIPSSKQHICTARCEKLPWFSSGHIYIYIDNIYIYIYVYVYIYIYIYIRVNYNDSLRLNPGIMIYLREIIPNWPNKSG